MGTALKTVADLAYGVLADAIDATQDYFACEGADVVRFADLDADFIVTIGDPGPDGLYAAGRELVLVGARSDDDFTSVTRSHGGTTAPVGGWPAGTPIRANWGSLLYQGLVDAINAIEDNDSFAALSALTPEADAVPYFTGSASASTFPSSGFSRGLMAETTAAGWRSALGVQASGSYQPLDPTLTALAGVGAVADRLPYFNGTDTATVTPLTALARTLLAGATPASMQNTLDLVPGVDVQAWDAQLDDIAGLSVTDGNIIVGDGTHWITESGAIARASLGLTIGTHVQAWDALLDSLALLGTGADKMPYFTAANTAAETTLTSFARTLLDDADATAARSTLGLVIGTNVQAYDAELAALAGLTSAANKLPYFTGSGTAALTDITSAGRSILDDATVGDIRTTLGVGTADSPSFVTVTATNALNVGSLALWYPGTENIILGQGAFANYTTAYYNIAVGYESLLNATSATSNIAIGRKTLRAATTASYNIAIGRDALYSLTTGDSDPYIAKNVAIGWQAMSSATVSAWCTAIGTEALSSLTTASFNTAVGYQALYLNTTGNSNVAIGVQSQWKNIGLRNVTVGNDTMHAAGATGSHNVALGYGALFELTSGYGNTCLGYGTGDNLTTGSYNIVIGHDLDAASATANYQLNIGGIITASSYNAAAGATLNLVAGTIASGLSALTLFNTTAQTVSAFGAGTSIGMGAATGTFTVNNATFKAAQTVQIGTQDSVAGTLTIYGNNSTTGPKIVLDNAASEGFIHPAYTIQANGDVLDIQTGTSSWTLCLTDGRLQVDGDIGTLGDPDLLGLASDAVTVNGTAQITDRIGVGTAPVSGSAIRATITPTADANALGLFFSCYPNATATSRTFYGGYFGLYPSGGSYTSCTFNGLSAWVGGGSATVTMPEVNAVYAGLDNTNVNQTITTAYLFRGNVSTDASPGTVTNLYGLYLPDITAGSTINYAIYTNAGSVRFGGTVTCASTLQATTVTGTTSLVASGGLVTSGVAGTTRGVLEALRGASTNTPGVLKLVSKGGTAYYFFVTDAGVFRVHTSLPTADTDGSAV